MVDICGNPLTLGSTVLVLSDTFYEGAKGERQSWSETFGIIVGENQVFIRRYKNSKQLGYKTVDTGVVVLVKPCDEKTKEIFNDLQFEYLKQALMVATGSKLKPGDLFKELSTNELYLYLGNLDIKTYYEVDDAIATYPADSINGNICIKPGSLINRYNKTIRSKEIYSMEFDIDKFYNYMFSNHNMYGNLDRDLLLMDKLGLCVGEIVGHLSLTNICINKVYIIPRGCCNNLRRLVVKENIQK